MSDETIVVGAEGDGISDAVENAGPNGGDGIIDLVENASPCLSANDADTDDDGIIDGNEDANHDGIVDPDETDPCDIDTDGDGIQDETEE